MAVSPIKTKRGLYVRYEWVLTASDYEAVPTPYIPWRTEKTVDVHGASDADGFNGAVLDIQGSIDLEPTGRFKLLNTVPDTLQLSFTAAASVPMVLLPNVGQVKPVVSAGAPGAVGITVVLVVTSARSHTE